MERKLNPANANDPATKRQCWALFCAVGKTEGKTYRDYVQMAENYELTKGQASEMISNVNGGNNRSRSKGRSLNDVRKMTRDQKFQEIWDQAVEAGRKAGEAAIPTPIVVTEHANPLDDNSPAKNQWYVSDGACGFAWVIVKPGTSAFSQWLKKMDYARTDSYYGGVSIWISDYNQSVTRKEAHARAMAQALSDAGFKAYSMSRLD